MRGVFFYSSIFSSASETGSSTGKFEGGFLGSTATCLDWFSKFLFKALSNFFWVSSNEISKSDQVAETED